MQCGSGSPDRFSWPLASKCHHTNKQCSVRSVRWKLFACIQHVGVIAGADEAEQMNASERDEGGGAREGRRWVSAQQLSTHSHLTVRKLTHTQTVTPTDRRLGTCSCRLWLINVSLNSHYRRLMQHATTCVCNSRCMCCHFTGVASIDAQAERQLAQG